VGLGSTAAAGGGALDGDGNGALVAGGGKGAAGGADGAFAGAVAHADNPSAPSTSSTRMTLHRPDAGRDRYARGASITDGSSMNGSQKVGSQWVEASGAAVQDWPAGALYVVATPIGNAADITLRALWLLSMADAVFAEDTRVTRLLLDRYGIRPPALQSAHEHNEQAAAAAVAGRLASGERVALVTDAGTPAVSDPGARIVRAVRAAGFRVIPLPGASSLLAALAASGLAETGFSFLGFLPAASRERERILRAAATRGDAFALFEAPHRIEATAQALAQMLDPARRVAVARELTKKFESIDVVTAIELPALIERETQRGEYVLVIDSAPAMAAATEIDAATLRWLVALVEALPASKAAAIASKATGLPRDQLYRELVAGRGDRKAV
jgi:16S rRNA (cytidine1402-2'-O)-methyltransferase